MIITPDFSEASDSSRPIPDGVYKARVVDFEIKDTKKGEKRISWKLQVFGAEGELAEQNNRPFFHSTMISGKGAGMLRDFLKACGKELEPGHGFLPENLLGSEVEATLQKRFNDDGTESAWSNVKNVRPARS